MSFAIPTNAVTLPANWLETEKGNTMLETDNGQLSAWIRIKGSVYLEVTNTPGNSPQFYAQLIQTTKKALIRRIRETCAGWDVVRWNLSSKAPVDCNNCIRDLRGNS